RYPQQAAACRPRGIPSTSCNRGFRRSLAPAQFGNAVFAAKSIEYDPNLILSRIVFARRSPNLSDDLFGRRLRCPGFLSHLRSLIGYDEPEILLSSSH